MLVLALAEATSQLSCGAGQDGDGGMAPLLSRRFLSWRLPSPLTVTSLPVAPPPPTPLFRGGWSPFPSRHHPFLQGPLLPLWCRQCPLSVNIPLSSPPPQRHPATILFFGRTGPPLARGKSVSRSRPTVLALWGRPPLPDTPLPPGAGHDWPCGSRAPSPPRGRSAGVRGARCAWSSRPRR